MQLKRNYAMILEGDEVIKMRELLASIPIGVSQGYPQPLREFHQKLFEILREV